MHAHRKTAGHCFHFSLVLLFLFPSSAFPQLKDSIVVLPGNTVLVAMRDSAGHRFCHYAEVSQHFDSTDVGWTFGEICVVRHSGDTVHVPFDHPKADMLLTDPLQVYADQSNRYQNGILSREFTVTGGDTLQFYREPVFRFPETLPDGNPFPVGPGTRLHIPDSVIFRVSVLRVLNGRAGYALQVDSAIFLPTPAAGGDSFWPYYRHTIDSTVIESFFCRKTVLPRSLENVPLRLKLDVVYGPQTRSISAGRDMHVRFSWKPQASFDVIAYINDAQRTKGH